MIGSNCRSLNLYIDVLLIINIAKSRLLNTINLNLTKQSAQQNVIRYYFNEAQEL